MVHDAEIWMPLKYPGIDEHQNRFLISSHGRLMNKNTQRILKSARTKYGYYVVRTTFGKRTNKINIIIHRAVAYTYIPNTFGLPEVNHKDGNKANNRADNLEWCTTSYNQKHKYAIGLVDASINCGSSNPNAKRIKAFDGYGQ